MARYFRHTRLFLALAAAALVMTVPARTRAQILAPEPVIWDLKVVIGAADVSCGDGWMRVDQDLDAGADGEYVYLCISHLQNEWSTPVGGISVVYSSSFEDDGHWLRVPSVPDRAGYLNNDGGDALEFRFFRSAVDPVMGVKFEVDTYGGGFAPWDDYFHAANGGFCNDDYALTQETLWEPMQGVSDLNHGAAMFVYIFGCEKHQTPRGRMATQPLYGFAVAVDEYDDDTNMLTKKAECPRGWTTVSPDLYFGDKEGGARACMTHDPNATGASRNPITSISVEKFLDDGEWLYCSEQKGGWLVDGGTNLDQPGNFWADDENADEVYFCVSRTHSPLQPNRVVDDFRVLALPAKPEDANACQTAFGPGWEHTINLTKDKIFDSEGDSARDTMWRYPCVHYAELYGADRFDATWTAPDRVTAEANIRTTDGSGAFVNFEMKATAFDGQDLEIWCQVPGWSDYPEAFWMGGYLFSTGTTRLECRASGNDSSPRGGWHGIDVVVTNSPPELSIPAVPVVEATSAAGAVVTFSASALDALDGTRPVTCDPPSGSTFPVGNSQSQCRATDLDGQQSVRTVGIHVRDTIEPAILAPLDAYIGVDTVGMGAQVSDDRLGTPIVTDNAIRRIWRQPSISFFPYGTTQVTWIVEDMGGHMAMATQRVVVGLKAELPSVTAPASLTVEAAGPFGAMISPEQLGQPTSTGAAITSMSRNPNIGVFPVGTTTITWSVFAGPQMHTVQQRVTVVDTKAPVVTGRSILSLDQQGPLGGYIQLESANAMMNMVTATDAVGVVSLTPSPAGPWFPLGSTDVTWTARDAAGNAGTFVMKVIVRDQTAPAFDSAPAAVTAEATSAAGALVTDDVLGRPIARDSGGEVTVTRIPAGNQFPLGETVIRWVASDPAGNSSEVTQVVKVADTTPPVVTGPAAVTVEAVGVLTPVTFDMRAVDAVDGLVPVSCTPAPGSSFPIGTTNVNCQAFDRSKNAAKTASVAVIVRDTTAPVLSLPAEMRLRATSAFGASVSYSASAVDLVDGPVLTECSPAPGSTVPVGVTTVNCTARDSRSNAAAGAFTIEVTPLTAQDVIAMLDAAIDQKRLDQRLRQILRAIDADRDRRSCANIAQLRRAVEGNRKIGDVDRRELLDLIDTLVRLVGCGS